VHHHDSHSSSATHLKSVLCDPFALVAGDHDDLIEASFMCSNDRPFEETQPANP
jgi:hypothetical protein